MTLDTKSQRIFSFGPFRLDLFERTLKRDGKAVALAPKLFDTLAILVENGGRIIEKDELMAELWQDTFVEESSLSQNIFQLRKILNAGAAEVNYIETVPKRGYRFAKVITENGEESIDTSSAEAQQAYLLGTYFSNKRTNEALARSIDYFHEAIVLDPGFGSAHAGLADSHFWLAYNEIDPVFRRESFELSRVNAIRSIELNPSSAIGYAALATVQIKNDHDASRADISFKKAIEADSDCGMAYSRYAYFLAAVGRLNEAMTMIRRAHHIDPLSPDANASLALIHYFQRDYDAAIKCCRTGLALEPASVEAMLLLGRAYQEKGLYKDAVVMYEKAKGVGNTRSESDELLACLYALTGRTLDTEKALANALSFAADRQVRSYNLAAVYSALGDENSAIDWLERPFMNWTERLRMLRYDPRLDDLRTHPRFADIVEAAMSPDGEDRPNDSQATISIAQTIAMAQ